MLFKKPDASTGYRHSPRHDHGASVVGNPQEQPGSAGRFDKQGREARGIRQELQVHYGTAILHPSALMTSRTAACVTLSRRVNKVSSLK